MIDSRFSISLIACAIFVGLLLGANTVSAQVTDRRWSEPYQLSSAEGQFSPYSNFMLPDTYGNLHTFWVEEGFGDNRSIIQYARFDGDTWSPPIDLYLSGQYNTAAHPSAAIDSQGNIHLVWSIGGLYRRGPAYRISAPAHDTLSAHKWSEPDRIDVPSYQSKLLIDSNDIFHFVYAKFNNPEAGVYYIYSKDAGETWSNPEWLDPDIPPGQIVGDLDFALDDAGGLHVVWQYIEDSTNAMGMQILYVRSLDGGENWSLPAIIDEPDEAPDELRLAVPALAVQGDNVHVVYAGDAMTRREHRHSEDRGETWGLPRQVFGNLLGQAQGDGVAVDSAGRVHFAGDIRDPQALWHAYWQPEQGYWRDLSPVYRIVLDAPDPSSGQIHAHSIALAVNAGNQLVTTFYDRTFERGYVLYAMHRTLDDLPRNSLAVPPAIVSTVAPTAVPPRPTPFPDTIALASQSDPSSALVDSTAPVSDTSPARGLLVGIIPVLLFVILLLTYRIFMRVRRRVLH